MKNRVELIGVVISDPVQKSNNSPVEIKIETRIPNPKGEDSIEKHLIAIWHMKDSALKLKKGDLIYVEGCLSSSFHVIKGDDGKPIKKDGKDLEVKKIEVKCHWFKKFEK